MSALGRTREGISGASHLFTLAFVAGCGGGSASVVGQPTALVSADPKSGGAATTLDSTADAYTNSVSHLTSEQDGDFSFGHSVFNQNWVTAPSTTTGLDGLGPRYNARGCSSCHSKDGRSPPFSATTPGQFLGMLFRLSIPGTSDKGGPNPDPVYGDQLRPFAILGVPVDATPHVTYTETSGSYADGTTYSLQTPAYWIDGWNYGEPQSGLMISPRVAPIVVGLGLLEAVPEQTIVANVHASDADGVHGTANYVWDAVNRTTALGRFGWKANQPSTLQQTAGAFLGDIGVTSSLFSSQACSSAMSECNAAPTGDDPDFELSDDRLKSTAFYMQTLAVPARRSLDDPAALHGEELFTRYGCASCHLTTLQTGAGAADVLSNQTIHPYTDLLLHDMGPELADNRADYQASGTQWRTPPLWGIGLLERVNHHSFLLHDGRARGVAEAILWHGGEATTARERFRNAEASERDALLTFIGSL